MTPQVVHMLLAGVFFFFQAEDGIRDLTVTGVQTCALPIYSLETYRDLLSSTLDSYLTQVSNRLGLATKGLSVVATVTLPFVIISGMWGMKIGRASCRERV